MTPDIYHAISTSLLDMTPDILVSVIVPSCPHITPHDSLHDSMTPDIYQHVSTSLLHMSPHHSSIRFFIMSPHHSSTKYSCHCGAPPTARLIASPSPVSQAAQAPGTSLCPAAAISHPKKPLLLPRSNCSRAPESQQSGPLSVV